MVEIEIYIYGARERETYIDGGGEKKMVDSEMQEREINGERERNGGERNGGRERNGDRQTYMVGERDKQWDMGERDRGIWEREIEGYDGKRERERQIWGKIETNMEKGRDKHAERDTIMGKERERRRRRDRHI